MSEPLFKLPSAPLASPEFKFTKLTVQAAHQPISIAKSM